MSHAVRVLCRPAVAHGFALAGVPALAVAGAAEAADGLARLARQPEVGVVLVEEELWAGLPEGARHRLEREPLPVVVPFPGPAWVEREEPGAYVLELLRRAIGYRVRLR